jgi:hypothetical protein
VVSLFFALVLRAFLRPVLDAIDNVVPSSQQYGRMFSIVLLMAINVFYFGKRWELMGPHIGDPVSSVACP